MPAPQIVPLPENFDMADGMRIVVTAVDASTNATVSGVTISNVSIDVDPLTDDGTSEAPEAYSDPGSPFYFGDVPA